MERAKGILYAALSSSTFGLAPLFTLLLLAGGYSPFEALSYRWGVAALFLGVLAVFSGRSFRLGRRELVTVFLLSLFRAATSLSLIIAYQHIASGVASTIHFMYPVLTTLIMMIFFREKKSPWRIAAIALAVNGVFFLSHGDTTGTVTLLGIFIVLLSALGYALYLVTVSQLKSLEMKGLKMTFYVFLFGGILLFTGMTVTGVGVQAIPDRITLGNLVMLALVPTVISNLALVRAIKNIGSTLTSVLGAMEPVTAVCVGILIFGEPFTQSIALGIGLIISAVTVIILKK